MRAIDRDRFIAMTEIRIRANTLVWLSDMYKTEYLTDNSSAELKMNELDDIWRQITEHQIRLTEILREHGR
jgi:hypothetical protein